MFSIQERTSLFWSSSFFDVIHSLIPPVFSVRLSDSQQSFFNSMLVWSSFSELFESFVDVIIFVLSPSSISIWEDSFDWLFASSAATNFISDWPVDFLSKCTSDTFSDWLIDFSSVLSSPFSCSHDFVSTLASSMAFLSSVTSRANMTRSSRIDVWLLMNSIRQAGCFVCFS